MVQGNVMSAFSQKPIVKKPKYQAPPLRKKSTQQIQRTQVTQVVTQVVEPPRIEQPEPSQIDTDTEQTIELAQIREPQFGQVVVRYSHYKDKFPIKDGILLESDIDALYCLSHVFKGHYKLILRMDNGYMFENIGGRWKGCQDGGIYLLDVDEDPEQAAIDQLNSKPFKASDLINPDAQVKKNRQVEMITQELKGMTMDDLEEKGAKYRELVEARDLEDILYK